MEWSGLRKKYWKRVNCLQILPFPHADILSRITTLDPGGTCGLRHAIGLYSIPCTVWRPSVSFIINIRDGFCSHWQYMEYQYDWVTYYNECETVCKSLIITTMGSRLALYHSPELKQGYVDKMCKGDLFRQNQTSPPPKKRTHMRVFHHPQPPSHRTKQKTTPPPKKNRILPPCFWFHSI